MADQIVGLSADEFHRQLTIEPYQIYRQFEQIKGEPTAGSFAIGMQPANKPKCRYNDVPCMDDTRVVLNNWRGGDFVHANYVDIFGQPKSFIAAQGPMEGTAQDFWAMVVQCGVQLIVAIGKPDETTADGRPKVKYCRYWPKRDDGTVQFGRAQVDFIREGPVDRNYRIFHLNVTIEPRAQPHRIRLIWWHQWPDRGLPTDPAGFARFLRKDLPVTRENLAKNLPGQRQPPVLVHCSAGIGRTGTMITLASVFARFDANRTYDVFETVRAVRRQRIGSIQTAQQYAFIHLAICRVAVKHQRLKFTLEELQGLCLPDNFSNQQIRQVLNGVDQPPPLPLRNGDESDETN